MISKNDLITELLSLIDENPLTEIDVKPILEKHSAGLDFNEQKILRSNLDSAARQLEDAGYLTKYNFNFSASYGENWASSSGMITGTIKRKEKSEQLKRELIANKPPKPKWQTLDFYLEELAKHYFIVAVVTITGILWLSLRSCDGKDIKKVEKENKQPTLQQNSPKLKDTVPR